MSKIGGYNVYQHLFDAPTNSKKTKETDLKEKQKLSEQKMKQVDKADKENKVNLSKKAQKLLEELKRTYGNMDFIVADYETDEEAQAYLDRGTKEYSVLIDTETLEAMAADEDTKQKYIGVLEDSVGELAVMKNKLGDKEEEVSRIGISIGSDGKVSFFAELEKVGERQKEFVDKMRESKKTTVKADSAEELLEKIKAVDWEKIKAEEVQTSGSKFDFSV